MKNIFKSQQGAALAELAIMLPLLLSLVFVSMELSRFALLHLKLDKTAATMSDLVTQRTAITLSDLSDITNTATHIMKPLAFDGSILISSVVRSNNAPAPCAGVNVTCITWQYSAGDSIENSRIGSPGEEATIPGNYELLENQNLITAEVFMNYSPILDLTADLIPVLAPHTIYKVISFKPRQGTLVNPPD